MNSGLSVSLMSVALPESDLSRQTKPGLDSASTLTSSSRSMNPLKRGSSIGKSAVPTFIWARCHWVISSHLRRLHQRGLAEAYGFGDVVFFDHPAAFQIRN